MHVRHSKFSSRYLRFLQGAIVATLLVTLTVLFSNPDHAQESDPLPPGGSNPENNNHVEEVLGWLDGKDINNLSVAELQWCLQNLLTDETIADAEQLQISWTGMVSAPQAGSYQFSTSPVNVNQRGPFSVEQRIVVTVGGQIVLDTLAGGEEPRGVPQRAWHWQGQDISLQAETPVPIQVVMTYTTPRLQGRDAMWLNVAPPAAILCWEGPGLKRQVVSSDHLFSDASQADLQVEYRWPSEQGDQTVTELSENVDLSWSSLTSANPSNLPLINQLTDRLFELVSANTYLDACKNDELRHVYFTDPACTDYLSTNQRQQFLQQLLADQELLQKIQQEELADLYRRFRIGAEEQALGLLGNWLSLQPDIAPEIAWDYFPKNRQIYSELAQLLVQQIPERLEELQTNYLETESGHCVLPVAYTLSYTNLAKQQISGHGSGSPSGFQQWIEWLDSRLADDTLSGDTRVNWLLTRSLAAEIRYSPILARSHAIGDLLAGRDWLTEAKLVVESPEVQSRLALEWVSRQVLRRRWDEANQEVDTLVAQEDQASWKDTLSQFKAEFDARLVDEQRRSESRVLAELERRRAKAEAYGNDAEAARYTNLIERANPIQSTEN